MTIEQILPILAALLFSLLEVTEGAKGSLRAGVMSRTNMRRKHPKYYDNGGWVCQVLARYIFKCAETKKNI